ncbi:NADH-quinone oxidoreductase subunit N [Microbacterium sp. LRZ72]|uniref:NADH-quinone oxidoreductase subunit N n=1 Tax=Microbacterium sp. LRZ72 TaxID=2942481 RepID=UPI0029B78FAF|nr:proton-conducting transporter membrane subunit [Microbacterium sp. LRZ72]MDX2376070.1 NADH-quinone oxidoreductase subunit N [Microbacterium sp. LRZ72]
MDPLLLLPELLVFLGGLGVLVLGSFLPRRRQWIGRALAAAALVAAIVTAAVAATDSPPSAFSGTFALDALTHGVRIVAPAAALLVLGLAGDEWAADARESELYALLLFATTGALVIGGAADLLVLICGFLLTSIPVYGLLGLRGGALPAEAAMKTYLLGAMFGIVLMGGVTLLYGLGATTVYGELPAALAGAPVAVVAVGALGVLAGLLFEAGAVPAHFWVPDAASGATGTVAAFVTTVPKIGALVAVLRFVDALPGAAVWGALVGVLAVVTMLLGNLAAYAQRDPRRLLGWSTVGQAGFLLVPAAVVTPMAVPALLIYLAAYALANVGAFAVTVAQPRARQLGDYRGMARRRPWLAAALLVALLGLVGTPPTAVFVGKLAVSAAAWAGGAAWLAVALLATTVLSLFYYLRWLAPAFLAADPGAEDAGAGSEHDPATAETTRWSTAVAIVAAAGTLAAGIGAGLLWSAVTGGTMPGG